MFVGIFGGHAMHATQEKRFDGIVFKDNFSIYVLIALF